jgi:hypothetical protein
MHEETVTRHSPKRRKYSGILHLFRDEVCQFGHIWLGSSVDIHQQFPFYEQAVSWILHFGGISTIQTVGGRSENLLDFAHIRLSGGIHHDTF